jgi:putative membrane protein
MQNSVERQTTPASNLANPYSRFHDQQLILRDELALDRTILANERTLLAYLRTVLALVLAGVTFLHFANAVWFSIVGIVCLVVGLAVLPLAIYRYRRMQSVLAPLRLQMGDIASATTVNDAESER